LFILLLLTSNPFTAAIPTNGHKAACLYWQRHCQVLVSSLAASQQQQQQQQQRLSGVSNMHVDGSILPVHAAQTAKAPAVDASSCMCVCRTLQPARVELQYLINKDGLWLQHVMLSFCGVPLPPQNSYWAWATISMKEKELLATAGMDALVRQCRSEGI
jgi:hypothetical protein